MVPTPTRLLGAKQCVDVRFEDIDMLPGILPVPSGRTHLPDNIFRLVKIADCFVPASSPRGHFAQFGLGLAPDESDFKRRIDVSSRDQRDDPIKVRRRREGQVCRWTSKGHAAKVLSRRRR